MDRVLTGELDGVLKFVSNCGTTVGSGLVGKEVGQGPLLVLADDGQGKFDELGPGLRRGAGGRGDVIKVILAVHKGDMEFPELSRADAGNSQCGLVNEGRSTVPRLYLLSDDHLDPSVVFASVLDERLDGSLDVVGHLTTEGADVVEEDVQGVGGSWAAQDKRTKGRLQGHFVVRGGLREGEDDQINKVAYSCVL